MKQKSIYLEKNSTVLDFMSLAINTGARYKTSIPAEYLNNVHDPINAKLIPGMFINPAPGVVQYVYKSTVYKDANNNIIIQ